MKMTRTAVTVRQFLDLVFTAYVETYGEAESERKGHPQDVATNVTTVIPALALGLASGREYTEWTDEYYKAKGVVP